LLNGALDQAYRIAAEGDAGDREGVITLDE
jgi:hypothetical protein